MSSWRSYSEFSRKKIVKFRSRKILALLIYLVVTEKRYSRDELMALLWSNSDSQRARLSLRNALYHLRQAWPTDTDPLLINGDQIQFNDHHDIHLDIAAVENALQPEATLNDWKKRLP